MEGERERSGWVGGGEGVGETSDGSREGKAGGKELSDRERSRYRRRRVSLSVSKKATLLKTNQDILIAVYFTYIAFRARGTALRSTSSSERSSARRVLLQIPREIRARGRINVYTTLQSRPFDMLDGFEKRLIGSQNKFKQNN